MDDQMITSLKKFVELSHANPSFLADPSLSFFRKHLESLEVPSSAYKAGSSDDDVEGNPQPKTFVVEDTVQCDVELVERDSDRQQKMGDEVTIENREASHEAMGLPMETISQRKLEEAIVHLSEAITLDPTSADLFATRAMLLVKSRDPDGAIQDATTALQLKPYSAKGFKCRGMARAMIGSWEEAITDLMVAATIDFDEELEQAGLKDLSNNLFTGAHSG